MVEIAEVYGRRAAHDVINWSREDYRERFSALEDLLARTAGDDDTLFSAEAA